MTKERTAPQSPEDMAKAAQEAAVKAAMEEIRTHMPRFPRRQLSKLLPYR